MCSLKQQSKALFLVMAASGGVLVELIYLFDAVTEFVASDEFGNRFFPLQLSLIFSASPITLKTFTSMIFMDRQPFERLV